MVVPALEPVPIERSLRLLASSSSIYEPFEGGAAERDEITHANQGVAQEVVERFRPDTILAGNLMFLDRRFLESLFRLGAPLAYLLTDVWLIQMLDDPWLQQYFKREVVAAGAVDLTPVDDLLSDVLAGARAPVDAAETSRRAEIEARLAAGRTAYQLSGVCHLCGNTVFLVRRPSPGTLAMPRVKRTSVTCGRCGLDGSIRAVIHAADSLAGERGSERVGILCADPVVARAVSGRHRGRIVAAGDELTGVDVIAALTTTPGNESVPSMLARQLRPDQRIVFAQPMASPPSNPRAFAAFEVWSERYGYLGEDHRVGLWSAG